MKKKRYIIYSILALISIITIVCLVRSTNAETITREATVQEIINEKNFVRETASLSRGKDSNNKVNKDTLAVELNKYVGTGKTSVTQKSTNRLVVRFIETGNEYELDIDTGSILYNIIYDANEGNGAPDSQTKYDGIDVRLSETIPTRTNYTFLGWSTNPDSVTATHRAGEIYTDDASITLYAVWDLNALPVTYYADTNEMYVEDVIIGENVLSPTSFTPSKTGWTFVGWRDNTSADGNVLTSKVQGETEITLYAIYKQEFTQTFISNGTTTKTVNKYYSASGNTKDATVKFPIGGTYSGWTWRGWSASGATTANAPVTYKNEQEITVTSDNIFYGLHELNVTLSYNGNGATSGSTASQNRSRYFNAAGNYYNPTVALSANGFSRSGYSFNGWDLGAVGTNITLDSNKTAKAQWKQNKAPQPSSSTAKVTCNNGPEAKGSVTINCTGWSTLTFTINLTAREWGGYAWCDVDGTEMSCPWGTSGSKNASYDVSGKSSVTIHYSVGGYGDVWLTNIRLN